MLVIKNLLLHYINPLGNIHDFQIQGKQVFLVNIVLSIQIPFELDLFDYIQINSKYHVLLYLLSKIPDLAIIQQSIIMLFPIVCMGYHIRLCFPKILLIKYHLAIMEIQICSKVENHILIMLLIDKDNQHEHLLNEELLFFFQLLTLVEFFCYQACHQT